MENFSLHNEYLYGIEKKWLHNHKITYFVCLHL
jgi:hypothetical protein